MEKVMESHGISKAEKRMNPSLLEEFYYRYEIVVKCDNQKH